MFLSFYNGLYYAFAWYRKKNEKIASMQNIMQHGLLKIYDCEIKTLTVSYDKTYDRYKKIVKNGKK